MCACLEDCRRELHYSQRCTAVALRPEANAVYSYRKEDHSNMNQKILHTPEGLRDIYSDECERKQILEQNRIPAMLRQRW